MVIALVIAIILGGVAALIGGLTLLALLRLANHGSTVAAGIQGLSSTLDALRIEVVSIGEDARLARREVTRFATAHPARPPEAAPAAPRPCARAEDPDGEVTLFFQCPANDGAPDRPPITPTKLSPAPALPSPKA